MSSKCSKINHVNQQFYFSIQKSFQNVKKIYRKKKNILHLSAHDSVCMFPHETSPNLLQLLCLLERPDPHLPPLIVNWTKWRPSLSLGNISNWWWIFMESPWESEWGLLKVWCRMKKVFWSSNPNCCHRVVKNQYLISDSFTGSKIHHPSMYLDKCMYFEFVNEFAS